MLIDGILEALHKVVPPGAQPLHEPVFAGAKEAIATSNCTARLVISLPLYLLDRLA